MSLRQLVEGDCGGVNPLMQLGGQFARDVARKDEGYTAAQLERSVRPDEQLVNEFLGQVSAPPQSFQMDALLQEMRDINIGGPVQLQAAPRVIDEVAGAWSADYLNQNSQAKMIHMQPQQQQLTHVREFFDEQLTQLPSYSNNVSQSMLSMMAHAPAPLPAPYMALSLIPQQQPQQIQQPGTEQFFAENDMITTDNQAESVENWINDFQQSKEHAEQTASNFNEKFWQRLQDEWQKLSEENEHPWLSEYNESLDNYKEYEFAEENPMAELDNAFEKGKEYLTKGDVPSAVLCFEVAAKKEPEKAEIWELLGMSQAENEMDPQSIAALRRALDLQPENQPVIMALAVCYTNEGLQSQAVKMLTKWLQVHPKYKSLMEQHPELGNETTELASSLIGGNKLQQLQELCLEAVRLNPTEIDPELQEVLGVLYNLSSEFDKAVDCFRAALHVNPENAKIWNRLGASLANGSRSVEAVEAYQHALQLQPGFIRVRYNVGVCCMNLKAYKEAVEHLITALTMQADTAAVRELPSAAANANQQQMSETIWSTLRMVVSLMGRNDLQGMVSDRNLSALNEAFKD